MTRCLRCLYLLINGGCPVCGGRRIKGVPPFTVLTRTEEAPLPIYWSPCDAAA